MGRYIDKQEKLGFISVWKGKPVMVIGENKHHLVFTDLEGAMGITTITIAESKDMLFTPGPYKGIKTLEDDYPEIFI